MLAYSVIAQLKDKTTTNPTAQE